MSIVKTQTQFKKQSRGGRPRITLSVAQKKLALEYVLSSGFWKIRLAKFLKIDPDTLNKILKSDKSFSGELEAAEAVFIGKTIQMAKPEFILKTKYKSEFPDPRSELEADDGSDEIREVILRIRKILPASGQ